LNRKKFYVAVRLIQLRQNNVVAKKLDLTVEKDVILEPAFFSGVSGVEVPLPMLVGVNDIHSFVVLDTCTRPPTPISTDTDVHGSIGYYTEEKTNEDYPPFENSHTHRHIKYENEPNVSPQRQSSHQHQHQYPPCSCTQVKKRQDKLESELAIMRNVLKDNLMQMGHMVQEIKTLRELVAQQNITVNQFPQKDFERQELKAQELSYLHDNSRSTARTALPVEFPLTNIKISPDDDDTISEIGMSISRPQNVMTLIFEPLNNIRRSFCQESSERTVTTKSVDSDDSRLERMQLKALCAGVSKDETSNDTHPDRRRSKGVFGWWKKAEGAVIDYVASSEIPTDGVPSKNVSTTVLQNGNLGLVGNQISNRTNVLKMNMIVNDNSDIKTPMRIVPLTSTLNEYEELLAKIKSNPAA